MELLFTYKFSSQSADLQSTSLSNVSSFGLYISFERYKRQKFRAPSGYGMRIFLARGLQDASRHSLNYGDSPKIREVLSNNSATRRWKYTRARRNTLWTHALNSLTVLRTNTSQPLSCHQLWCLIRSFNHRLRFLDSSREINDIIVLEIYSSWCSNRDAS